jgi:DNA polymerase I-like protein with 3'-5' exonuclease and polymerase domains
MLQMPLFSDKKTYKKPNIPDLPESWVGFKRICIDTETSDPHLTTMGCGALRDGRSVGYSITWEDTGQTVYLPFGHQGGDNLNKDDVINYIKGCAADFDGQLVGMNLPYDLEYLSADGVQFPKVKFFRDVGVAAVLIYELHDSYRLAKIGERLGIQSKSEEGLIEAAKNFGVHPKKELWKLPARYVDEYARTDTIAPLKILREQEKIIDKNNLWDIWNLESKVLPILVKMRRRGVLIDQDKLQQVEDWSVKEELKALAIIKDHTGYDIGLSNVMKASAIAPILNKIGIKFGKTKTGKDNIDKQLLLVSDHPVTDAILWARKTNKLRTTFAQSVRSYMVGGRINPTFNQIARNNGVEEKDEKDLKGARYGRLACMHPNIQQQPSRDDFANFWRSIYVCEEGSIWGCLDYSQQEPRWTTHFADLVNLKGARIAAEVYRNDPDADNHTMMTKLVYGDDVVKLDKKAFKSKRSICKGIYLGLCYGEGGAKLATDLNLPTRWALSRRGKNIVYFDSQVDAKAALYESGNNGYVWKAAGKECQVILDNFDRKVPFVRLLAKKAKQRAEKKGFVVTAGGRRLHFPEREGGGFDWTHKALNRVIQGSSADQTKKALVLINEYKPDSFIQLQVHDELDGSFGDVKEAQECAKIMRECMGETKVPFKVDVEIGKSWGEIEDVEKT